MSTDNDQTDDEPQPHELSPVFSVLDEHHPFYLSCSCGDVFRVDLVGTYPEAVRD